MAKELLIVDDSPTVRQQVRLALKREGFDVLEAVDGVDGLKKVGEHPNLKAVISDINMPEMDGIEFLKRMKANAATKDLPVIMLTTEKRAALVQKAVELGAVAWMVKPFQPAHLVKLLGKIT